MERTGFGYKCRQELSTSGGTCFLGAATIDRSVSSYEGKQTNPFLARSLCRDVGAEQFHPFLTSGSAEHSCFLKVITQWTAGPIKTLKGLPM